MRQLLPTLSTIAVASLIWMPMPAQDVYHGGSLDARQHGFEHGYRDGFAFGKDSQVSNRDQDIVNQKLRAADKDYQQVFGSQELYRQGYAEGFRSGMEDSRGGNRSKLEDLFRSRDPNFNPDRNRDDRGDSIYTENRWPATHLAEDFGYRDGLDAGISDRNNGRSFRPRQHTAWKKALHGYNGGNIRKAQYVTAYRDAYQAGYQDGFGRSR